VMQRRLFFLYGLLAHAMFLVVYAWMALFVGNFSFGTKLPTIDGVATTPLAMSLVIDLLLIALFGVQHSVMARPAFKRWWTRIIPQPIERSTYVLVSNLLVILLMLQWRPLGGVVWDVQHPLGRAILYGFFVGGWLMVPAVSLLINHFDLFGTRQVYLHLRGEAHDQPPFRTPLIYGYIRHPLYVGWMTAFWATPTMTVTHLVFAVLMTAYMLIAIPFEERDLLAHYGKTYADYRDRTGALMPRLKRAMPAGAELAICDADNPAG